MMVLHQASHQQGRELSCAYRLPLVIRSLQIVFVLFATVLLGGCWLSTRSVLDPADIATPFPARFAVVAMKPDGQFEVDKGKPLVRLEVNRNGRGYLYPSIDGGKPVTLRFAGIGSSQDNFLVEVSDFDGQNVVYLAAKRVANLLYVFMFEAKPEVETILRDAGVRFEAKRNGLVPSFTFDDRTHVLAAGRILLERPGLEPMVVLRMAFTAPELAAMDRDIAAFNLAAIQQTAPAAAVPRTAAAPVPAARRQPDPGSDRVHPCDVQAAWEGDPDRMAPGVELRRIVPRPALMECGRAVAEFPNTARFHLQLGRALMMAGQREAAFEAMNRAGALGSPIAWKLIGLNYANPVSGPMDLDRAAANFRLAEAAGVDVRQELRSVVFDPAVFSNPALFQATYNGQINEVSLAQGAAYFGQFMSRFQNNTECTEIDRGVVSRLNGVASLNLWGSILGGMMDANKTPPRGMGGAWDQGANLGMQVGGNVITMTANANSDAQRFFDRHGCTTPVAIRFFRNVNQWASR